MRWWPRKLWCALMGHDYQIWQRFDRGSYRLVCHCCKASWGVHGDTGITLRWSPPMHAMYESFGHRIKEWPVSAATAAGEG